MVNDVALAKYIFIFIIINVLRTGIKQMFLIYLNCIVTKHLQSYFLIL